MILRSLGVWGIEITIARRKAGQIRRGGTLEHLGGLDSGRGFSPLRPMLKRKETGSRIV